MIYERDNYFSPEIIFPSPNDFKSIFLKIGDRSYHSPMPYPTASDIFPLLEQGVLDQILENRKLKHTGSSNLYGSVITVCGGTGRGKTTLQGLIRQDLRNFIAMQTDTAHLVERWWEKEEEKAIENGKIDIDDIRKPFTNDQLTIVGKELENEIVFALKTGKVVLGVKPNSTYSILRSHDVSVADDVFVSRAFGENTLHNIMHLNPPFATLDSKSVFYLGCFGITASSVVTQIGTLYRDLLQRAYDKKVSLDKVNEICKAFKRNPFVNIDELGQSQEGGSLKQVYATEKGIRDNVLKRWAQGHMKDLSPEMHRILRADFMNSSDVEFLNLYNNAQDPMLIRSRSLAEKVVLLLYKSPSIAERAHVVRSEVYSIAEIYIQLMEFEEAQFFQSKSLSAEIYAIFKNDPDINQYMDRRDQIQWLREHYS
jgi:hypothetical protein